MLDKFFGNSNQSDENTKYISGKKNVLVTGGAGFLGSNLCQRLVKQNNVLCVDNYLTGQETNIDQLLQLPNFEFIKHDITEPADLNTLREAKGFKVEFQGIQEIYHAASPTHYQDHKDYPLQTSLANSLGTKNVLDWAKKHESKVVLFSTALVYGKLYGENYISEEMMGIIDPVGERNCYVEGKRYAESLAVNYKEKEGVDVKIARIFNTYGPKMRSSDNLLIPQFISKAVNNEEIKIDATGEEEVSACYVDDILDGVIKLMRSEGVDLVNLGSDARTKISDLVRIIIEQSASKSEVVYSQDNNVTVTRNIPDVNRAKEKLDWVPVTNLETGIKRTVEEFKLEQKRVKTFSQK